MTVSPSENVFFSWRRNGEPVSGGNVSSTLTLPAASQFDAGGYTVSATHNGIVTTSAVARLNVTLPAYPNAIEVDPAKSVELNGTEGGDVYAQAALPDGRYYLTGTFRRVAGQRASGIVRLTAVGAHDASFRPPEFDSPPRSIALQPDGKIVAAGPFKAVGGVPTGGIVRLNADGSRDPTFEVGEGFSGAAGVVRVAPDGSIYVFGSPALGSYRGAGNHGIIAKLTSAGLIDPAFTAPELRNEGFAASDRYVALAPDGAVYLAGSFATPVVPGRTQVVRLLPTGAVDPGFVTGTGANDIIISIVSLSTGQLLLGGGFTNYNGTSAGRIVRLNANGAIDPAFATGVGFSGQVGALAELPGNQIFVTSFGSSYKGSPVPSCIRLSATGNLDSSFQYPGISTPTRVTTFPGGRLLVTAFHTEQFRQYSAHVLESSGTLAAGYTPPTLLFPARANFMAHLPGGKIIVAGNFTEADGLQARYVLRLNADLSRDLSFPATTAATGPVQSGAVQAIGRIWLGTTDGLVITNFNGVQQPNLNFSSPPGANLSIPFATLRDIRMMVPTLASTWGGSPVTNGFVILGPDGNRVLDHPFLPGPPAGTRITRVEVMPSGKVFVAGTFSSWNGVPRARCVILNSDGSVDPTFVPDASTPIASLIPQPFSRSLVQNDGRVLAMLSTQQTVARLNPDGSRNLAYTALAGTTLLSGSQQVLLQPDDRAIISAQVPILGGARGLFVRLTRDGAPDPAFSVQGSARWTAALLSDQGELVAADEAGYLHRFRAQSPPAIATPPQSQTVQFGGTINLAVTTAATGNYTFQWSKDGTAVPGATNATFTLNNAASAAAGSYTVAIAGAGGVTTSSPAVVTIAPRPLAGTYFGQFGGNPGRFALFLRPDGTGVLLAFAPDRRLVLLARDVAVDPARAFRVQARAIAPAGTSDDQQIQGSIGPDGAITGSLPGFSLGFTGAFDATAPIAAAIGAQAGYFRGGAASTQVSAHAILGPSGQCFSVILGGGTADAVFSSVPAALAFAGTTEGGTPFSGRLTPGNSILSVTLAPLGAASLPLVLGNPALRGDPERLSNISARARVGGSAGALTAGFVVSGREPKTLLARGVGPSLTDFGVTGALAASRLEVFRGGNLIATGGAWGQAVDAVAIAATATRVGAFAIPPSSRDAALLLLLLPGAYSTSVTGAEGAAGVALVEIYDAEENSLRSGQRITNLSTLSAAGVGDDTLTVGFVVTGDVPKHVLVRAAGPSLGQFGVMGAVARPRLSLYSAQSITLQNAGWATARDARAVAQAAADAGAFAFPPASLDSADIIHLPAGPYSVQVTTSDGASGTALVEIYELP
ncbi:MAG: hypothetical protein JNL39_17385 [Opitutaceae bacterium]|nr:hypothetical protein [Opitutaceae bacterium]